MNTNNKIKFDITLKDVRDAKDELALALFKDLMFSNLTAKSEKEVKENTEKAAMIMELMEILPKSNK